MHIAMAELTAQQVQELVHCITGLEQMNQQLQTQQTTAQNTVPLLFQQLNRAQGSSQDVRPRHLEKFGFSSNCRKCVHIRTGDGSQPTLGHSQTCRKRIFTEVAKDPDMRFEVEAHERRKMKYLEAGVEQEDQRMKESEEIPQPQSAPTLRMPPWRRHRRPHPLQALLLQAAVRQATTFLWP